MLQLIEFFTVCHVFGIKPIERGVVYEPNEQALKIAYRNHNARVLQVVFLL